MAISELHGDKVPIKLWVPYQDVEPQAINQLKNTAALPWVFKHVAAMPDCHLGVGATVGSVIAMKDAIAPANVGVDIGCGMIATKTNLVASDLPDSLQAIFDAIEGNVPLGIDSHAKDNNNRRFRHGALMPAMKNLWKGYDDLTAAAQETHPFSKARLQMGSLGGGNHFIEVCLDTDQNVWVMLHSGSRYIGNLLAKHHIEIAKKLIHNQSIPDRDQAVFLEGTPEMVAYRRDLFWAQEYARLNRYTMLDIILEVLTKFFPQITFQDDPVHCHHNYVAEEMHYGEKVLVTRKGAIRAGKGDMGIIPGSMGAKSYIVRGLGCEEAFMSAPHGAGRKMSRGEAKRRYSASDVKSSTEGVMCRKDSGIVDEIPYAYKDIDQVIANSAELVEVVAQLKQVLCVKGYK